MVWEHVKTRSNMVISTRKKLEENMSEWLNMVTDLRSMNVFLFEKKFSKVFFG